MTAAEAGGWPSEFVAEAQALVGRFGVERLRAVAAAVAAGGPPHTVTSAVPVPGFAEAAARLLAALDGAVGPGGGSGDPTGRGSGGPTGGRPRADAAAYLRGLADGYATRAAEVRIESVWSGPGTHPVPVRATAQVLVDVVGQASSELLLMTYAAKPYPPLREALTAAVGRGVAVTVVVETLSGAGGALAGAEPAAAFADLPGIQLFHWPTERRGEQNAKMHAKIAVADRRVLLVSSANLTQAGVARNIEGGLLVHGGAAPRRAAEHIAELTARGVLARLRVGT